jgi:predicted GIY-YIG superfamily endonuclease
MKISAQSFLLLNAPGIDMFLSLVDQMVAGGAADGTYEGCAKLLQQRVHEYGKQLNDWNVAPVSTALPEPLTLAMGVLLDRRTCRDRRYRALKSNIVYVIRQGEQVLYVGSTRHDARHRIKSHQKAHSPLGEALRNHASVSEWSVEMIPHADYPTAFEKEKQLIGQLRPRFNLKV